MKCTDKRQTALEAALENGSNGFVKVIGDYYGKMLIGAASKKDAYQVKELLKRPGINVDQQDITGWTAMHYAMKHNSEMMVEVLLSQY